MNYFAIDYTIHFDDTMAYGSHHFLTGFKFQCASREAFLFGQQVYDSPGVRECLDGIHLFTADAYSRNLSPARLGNRVAILLTLEDWGRASARFCYRILGEQGQPIAAGFQTLVCADAATGKPALLPTPLWEAMEQLRAVEEPHAEKTFRDRVLAGGSSLEALFGPAERDAAAHVLGERYPRPQVVGGPASAKPAQPELSSQKPPLAADQDEAVEAWVFSGQGAFNADLLSGRVNAYRNHSPSAEKELRNCVAAVRERLGLNAQPLVGGSPQACADAVTQTPDLSQVAIYLQSVLGAAERYSQGKKPAVLMGHSFGEIAAMGVAGCFDLATGVGVVCERVRTITEHAPPGGGLLAVSAERSRLATEVRLLGLDQVVIAGRNHQRQTIASGPKDQLDQLGSHLRNLGINSVAVPSPTSFHHPRLRAAATAWRERLSELPLAGPKTAVYTPIGRRFLQADEDIALTLASQLLVPFDLQGAIADLAESGVTRLVDCGSTGALERLLSTACPAGLDVARVGVNARHAATTHKSTPPTGVPRTNGKAAAPPAVSVPTAAPVEPPPRQQPVQQQSAQTLPPVAIVGQGCLLPGGAKSPEHLFEAITQQRSGIVDLSNIDPNWSEDFFSEKLVPDKSTSHLMGRVNDEDIVAPAGVDPAVFAGFTRSQRLLCAALAPCVASLRDAEKVLCVIGATADGFEDQDVVASLRYAGIDPEDPSIDQRLNTAASAHSEQHDAVRHVFDQIVRPGLEVIIVDAACASSLYAVTLGMRALESGRADAVVAGGAFCPGPGNSCLFSQFNGTTHTGLRPFDATADGVVFSEGSALVTLRRVSDAERLGLPVSAVLRGAGLSSDGRSSSANVPQTHGQILSLQRCYDSYGFDPASISAVEAHGTSTPVGDSTEIDTLGKFYADYVSQPLPVHSLKGLLGHSGWAAGTASVIAVCEYLRHSVFPAQANFSQPSKAVANAAGTLRISDRAEPLPREACRVAVDGFGFGGANAHVVLESYDSGTAEESKHSFAKAEELVVVACSEVSPTVSTPEGKRFDRDAIKPPKGRVMLPDLQQDMDISQLLALQLMDGITSLVDDFGANFSQQTSVVLALSGKTERGVEATMRVLASRFRRDLAGLDQPLDKLAAAMEGSRPSGPYTLQCMMPNVSPGRAALFYNLNGPNFVVDAGDDSLEAAIDSAALLLQGGQASGAKMVVVGAIDANPHRTARYQTAEPQDEFAIALALTTRAHAEQAGLNVVGRLDDAWRVPAEANSRSTVDKVQSLLHSLQNPTATDTAEPPEQVEPDAGNRLECPIHTPVWVESPLPPAEQESPRPSLGGLLVITRDRQEEIEKLLQTLPDCSASHLVAVVGPDASRLVTQLGDPSAIAVNLEDEQSIAAALARIDDFAPSYLTAAQSIESWDMLPTLSQVADNGLGEFMFLTAQHCAARLRDSALELWGVFLEAWDREAHPSSGSVAGTLKAIAREIPAARVQVLCTRGLTLEEAFSHAFDESARRTDEHEVAYDGPKRLVRRLSQATSPQPASAIQLDADSVVVATGGARGVTALMAEALLQDFGCTVIALGRSELEPPPASLDDPNLQSAYYQRYLQEHPSAKPAEMKRLYDQALARWEAHATINRLANSGGRIEYRAVDITDHGQVDQAIRQIADEYGRIDLLLHGAGVQKSKLLQDRTLAEFRRTYAVKVTGLRNLVDACHQRFGKLVQAHVLTSAYSIFGNDGQHDYGAANETLDRICAMTAPQPVEAWSSIAWLAWDGVGMTRGSEYQALAKSRGLSGVTAEVGQRLFRQVISGSTGAAINVPMSDSEHSRYRVKVIPASPASAGSRLLEVAVDLSKIDCLTHHRVRSIPTLPGAWILERMVNAALQLCPAPDQAAWATVTDATFHRFVKNAVGQEPNVRIVAQQTPRGIQVWMIGDILHPLGTVLSKDVIFAEAAVAFSSECDEIHRAALRDLELQANDTLRDPYCDGQPGGVVQLSGPFDCVRDIAIGVQGRRARFASRLSRPGREVIPAYLLDSAWRVGAMYAAPNRDELYVPVRIGRVILPISRGTSPPLASDWEIRATAPRLEDGIVRWERTEAYSGSGTLEVIVDDALATPLR